MAKAVKVVGVIAGVVATGALIASGVGAVAVAGIALAKIATIAAIISAAATLGAQALAKPPPARGSVTQVRIEADAPTPYGMGEGLLGGTIRHDVAYGATLKKVPNPYRFIPVVYSLGPVESITPYINFAPISSWFSGFLFTDTQLGAVPETDALSPQWAGAPGWSTAHKLSGLAAIGWSFLFDKDGKRFANGIDPIAAYGKWVKVYDPRKDSTQPGGSGSHRLGDESTYEWSENPALHAGTYAYGRYQNGNRVFGIGMPADGIDWAVVAAWANTCDDNDWTIFGVIYEPGDRWANLKDICYAGGAEPVPGGVLTFKYAAPKVALDTITVDDLVTDDEMSLVTMQPYRDRLNTVIPKYRSPAHDWELIDAAPVVNSTFLTEDGEEKRDVWPFNFVKNVNQAAQLAAYRLFDSREISPITVVCKPRLRHYRPGECLHIVWDELGLDHDVVILSRNIDPVTMKVTFTLMTETPGKHAFCLGQTGVAPPTPTIGQTSQERDELAAAALVPTGYSTVEIAGSYTTGLAGNITQALSGSDAEVTIPTHNRIYTSGRSVTVDGDAILLPVSSNLLIYYDDPDLAGGSVVYNTTVVAADAYFSETNPDRHYIARVTTIDSGGGGGGAGGSGPPGGGGWDGPPGTEIP